ncbi:hypothetical protein DID88_005466 [Monilinia fructigena]|uniref:Uncharacterized protein n=1 Tax=Monilinia fructigena TaxID=38457 RepID=A0A395J066_9HELO|nr:hypothetical protein DID88_005466 [Monilinia fructigena]
MLCLPTHIINCIHAQLQSTKLGTQPRSATLCNASLRFNRRYPHQFISSHLIPIHSLASTCKKIKINLIIPFIPY